MRMKTLRHLLPLALLAACSNDQVLPDDQPADAGITTVIAYAPGAGQPATRTTLGPQSEDGSYPVLWNDGDAIAIQPYGEYKAGQHKKFTTTIAGGTAAFAEFTLAAGEGDIETSPEGYFAFYPYDRLITITTYSFGQIEFKYTVPSEQTAVAGSFQSGINPTIAYAKDLKDGLYFTPLNVLVKFSLKGDVVPRLKSVKLKSENSPAYLSGEANTSVSFNQESGSWAPVGSGDNYKSEPYVTLVAGDEPFQANTDYYMVLHNSQSNLQRDFTLTFTDESDKTYVKKGYGISNLDMGLIVNLGEIDLTDATFN